MERAHQVGVTNRAVFITSAAIYLGFLHSDEHLANSGLDGATENDPMLSKSLAKFLAWAVPTYLLIVVVGSGAYARIHHHAHTSHSTHEPEMSPDPVNAHPYHGWPKSND